ncbi:MAG: hypothetical protein GX811_03085 [Lentisphaerae bacterium]|nr:hypothetical protein [Lentisphaerota bacterium]
MMSDVAGGGDGNGHSTHLSRGGEDRLPTITSPVGRCCDRLGILVFLDWA